MASSKFNYDLRIGDLFNVNVDLYKIPKTMPCFHPDKSKNYYKKTLLASRVKTKFVLKRFDKYFTLNLASEKSLAQ